MMLALVGIALLLWFGSLLWAYALGRRNEAREWARWYMGKRAADHSYEKFDITEFKVPDGEDYPPFPENDIKQD